MKRLARLAFVTGLAVSLCAGVGRGVATATPFSDVPANHWAYQYIQSLAADGIIDGYPDGMFKGDRPLTRYEMAVVVARVIAKLQENQGSKGPSKEDLDKLQKLIDALKDELDALGVRVTNLEDSLDALEQRTKFAQSLTMHGVFLPNVSFRQRPDSPESIANTTGGTVSTWYGSSAPPGSAANPTAVTGIDPFVNAYLTTDDSNNPFTQSPSGIQIRQDSRFSLAYQVDDNLTVSIPVHILDYEYGGEYSADAKFDVEPGVDISVAHAGALSNVTFKFGIIDDMTSSRTGLAFRAPQGYSGVDNYSTPYQPYQKGVEVAGTVGEGAFGATDFQLSFTRMDDVRLDTQTNVTDPNVLPFEANSYLYTVIAPQATYTQSTPAGVLKTDTFNAGSGTLRQVYLTQAAVIGSVYISYFDGASFNSAGVQTGGPSVALPGFTFNQAYNSVVFSLPLPPGSVVGITYRNINNSENSSFQRYMVHGRLDQKFKGYQGAEIGVTFNRIFDYDDTETSGSGPTGLTFVNGASPDGYGEVSDTVFGLDAQAPVPFNVLGPDSEPVVYGEVADSKYTPDYTSVAAVDGGAGVFGVRLKVQKVEVSAQYQAVGADFFSGAPFRYFGNAPALFAYYRGNYYPDFFGFANDVGINAQFDRQFTRLGLANPDTSGNPNLTYAYPIFDQLKATGPTFFSAFAPDSRGETVAVDSPVRIGGFSLTARASYQHLQEIVPDGYGSLIGGAGVTSNVPESDDAYSAGTTFAARVLRRKATIDLSGQYEALKRIDTTAYQYYPFNPSTQTFDATAVQSATANFPGGGPYGAGSAVSYYPNYLSVRHITIGAKATMPLTNDLDLAASYSTQRFGGAAGTTLTQNISERKDYYTGSLTYTIPKSNSSLTFLARHYSYTDDVVPNLNLSENRQDINFTVRF
jgi:hypothetical protein